MSRWFLVCLVVGCGSSKPEPVPPKKPNNELVVGDFERRKPSGEQAFRFDNNGNYFVVKNKGELDHTPHISDGTYKVDGNKLTFSADKGACSENAAEKDGTYEVVISKIGIRFVKVNDPCETRSHLDGQTLWRIK
jgi:hypothetical protein